MYSDCEKFDEDISSLIDNEIDDKIKDKTIDHINSCDVCRNTYANVLFTTKLLNEIEDIELPNNFHSESMKIIKNRIEKELTHKKAKEKIKLIDLVYMRNLANSGFKHKFNFNNRMAILTASFLSIIFLSFIGVFSLTANTSTLTTEPTFYGALSKVAPELKGVQTDYDEMVVKYYLTIDSEKSDDAQNILNEYQEYVSSKMANATKSMIYSEFVLNVPIEQYDFVVSQIKSIGNVTSQTETKTSVLNEKMNLKHKISVKEVEQSRVLELIQKTDNVKNMILVDNRLNQITTDLDALKSQLNSLNRESSYPQIILTVVEDTSVSSANNNTLLNRINISFSSSVNNTTSLVESVILSLVYFIVPLCIVFVFIVVFIVKKRRKGVEDENTKK